MGRFEIGLDIKEIVVTWFKVSENMLCDDLEVLLSDKAGNVHIGSRDEYGFWDDHSQELYDIAYWAYIPRPVQRLYPSEPIITNDEWITNAAKKGMLI